MKKLLIALSAMMLMGGVAQAKDRYVLITHSQGADTFWPVVHKGARDAAKAVKAKLEYNFAPSGDMADMASLIQAAVATQPAGLIVSVPDADALAPVIRSAVAAGIPVITINSGLEASAKLGALMHIGQPERVAGTKAGERAKAEGAKNALCLNQESFNTALADRCAGYASKVKTKMIDVSNDVAQIEARTAAALQANRKINALLATGPHVCSAAAKAVASVGATVHLSCFDLDPSVIDLIKAGKVAFTIDQQQRLQGYMPVIVLSLYNANAGLLPGANIPSGPGFVDKSNAASVASQAGVNR